MKNNIEKDLNAGSVFDKIINPKTNFPYSVPEKSWSIPVYFIWRMLRYDLGEDLSYPVIAQGMIANHPQENESKQVLSDIELGYPELEGYNEMRRIV